MLEIINYKIQETIMKVGIIGAGAIAAKMAATLAG